MKKTVKKSDYRHKQWFRANINGDDCIGRVSMEGDEIYLCQYEQDGASADDKLGFPYSWQVGRGSEDELRMSDVENLKLLSRKPAYFEAPISLPYIGDYRAVIRDNGETIRVGCTPVSRELYLKVGRLAGWIE
jgi:hypothetical protein